MELINACKVYNSANEKIYALNNVNIKINESKGGFYAIMGASGSGKTTLIEIMGLLDELTDGEYILNNKKTKDMTENEKTEIRSRKIGFIFQSFYLNKNLTALENVMLPMMNNKEIKNVEKKLRASKLLEQFGMEKRSNHYPKELSAGEMQRVAIARALANNPDIILADEPTGNLDSKNEINVLEYLKKISKKGKCIIMVTHNDVVRKYADYILKMKDGVLEYEVK